LKLVEWNADAFFRRDCVPSKIFPRDWMDGLIASSGDAHPFLAFRCPRSGRSPLSASGPALECSRNKVVAVDWVGRCAIVLFANPRLSLFPSRSLCVLLSPLAPLFLPSSVDFFFAASLHFISPCCIVYTTTTILFSFLHFTYFFVPVVL
jgi:hypothetical protein